MSLILDEKETLVVLKMRREQEDRKKEQQAQAYITKLKSQPVQELSKEELITLAEYFKQKEQDDTLHKKWKNCTWGSGGY